MNVKSKTFSVAVGAICLVWGAPGQNSSAIHFEDTSEKWKISPAGTHGGEDHKDFIIETTGSGAGILDFDNDGRQDLLLLTGTTLGPHTAPARLPSLYRNEGNARFKDVSAASGLDHEGWAQAVCAGDYDNDGFTNFLITYYGHNRLYRNNGGKSPLFIDVTASVKLPD